MHILSGIPRVFFQYKTLMLILIERDELNIKSAIKVIPLNEYDSLKLWISNVGNLSPNFILSKNVNVSFVLNVTISN